MSTIAGLKSNRTIGVRMDGLPTFIAHTQRFVKGSRRNVKAGVVNATRAVARIARQSAPHDTGTLESAIQAVVIAEGNNTIVASVEVVRGMRNPKKKRFVGKGKRRMNTYADPFNYAPFMERKYGFMKHAKEAGIPHVKREFRSSIKTSIDDYIR